MAAGTRCENCGGRQSVAGATHCAFCGVLLKEPPPPPSPFGDVDARFAALREHRGLERMMRERPPAAAGIWPGAIIAAFGLLFGGVAFAMWSSARSWNADFDARWNAFGGMPRWTGDDVFDVMPLLFVAIGVSILAFGIYRVMGFRRAPWEAFPGLVVGERTHVSGGGGNSAARTTYHVTVEREGGRRREYRTTGNMAGGVRPGDMGIAHMRDGMLLGFRRLRV